MKSEGRSLRYLGLMALALTAGALRLESEVLSRDSLSFHALSAEPNAESVSCDDRLDPSWLSECSSPRVALLTTP